MLYGAVQVFTSDPMLYGAEQVFTSDLVCCLNSRNAGACALPLHFSCLSPFFCGHSPFSVSYGAASLHIAFGYVSHGTTFVKIVSLDD